MKKITKPLNPKSESFALTAVAKNPDEQDAISYFKEVCLRDGLEMRSELIKLIKEDWVVRHPKPGNPQLMLFQSLERGQVHKESVAVCEVCGEPAVYTCETVFPINSTKSLCQSHTVQFERRREVISKRKI